MTEPATGSVDPPRSAATSVANRTRPFACLLYAASIACVAAVAVGFVAYALPWSDFVSSYALTNTAFAVFVPTAGLLLALHRPRNPIGWLLLVDGLAHGLTAATVPYLAHGHQARWDDATMRSLSTLFAAAWPFGIGALLPLALQLFPAGRPLPGRWRWLVYATAANGVLFDLLSVLDPSTAAPMFAPSWLAVRGYHSIDGVWTIVNLLTFVVFVLTLASLVVRYRRGDERMRRQLLWLLLAVALTLLLNIGRFVTGRGPVLTLLSFALIPAAVVIAILRHQLLDIRLVVSRAVVYAGVSTIVVTSYVLIVAAADPWLHRISRPLAALVIAVVFNPLRARLQRLVDRAMYGMRHDPVRALSQVGAHLSGATDDLTDALDAARLGLRLRGLELRSDIVVAVAGDVADPTDRLPLAYGGERMGDLVVGLRPGERRLDARDATVLSILGASLAVAVHALRLSQQVRDSRERIVSAREEERRRLRRDLHDGLGPALTGVTLKADAARNMLDADPAQSKQLLAELRADTTNALRDVRRLVYDLRPPDLDTFGLADATRRLAEQFSLAATGPALRAEVHIPRVLPPLSPAVEVAAYRIVSEALTNVARHAGARHACVVLDASDALRVEVVDDGHAGEWEEGVGLRSMQERAAELGGTCVAGPVEGGWRVVATLPIRTSPELSTT